MEVYKVHATEYYPNHSYIDTDLCCFTSLKKANDFADRMQDLANENKLNVCIFCEPVSFNDEKAGEEILKVIGRIE